MKSNGRLFVFILLLVILATACKFFFGPDLAWSGFSPVIAIALFSGFIVRQKDMSFLFPLLALVVSDFAIQVLYEKNLFPYAGFYSGQWLNYLILFSATLVGWLLKGRKTISLIAGVIVAPTVFFLLSNFNVWASQEVLYPKNFSGLMTCYAAGLPFYKNALMATVIFLPVILFGYNYLTRNRPVLTVA
ncbi:MAG: DUF6580 family putative transport protein [Bacteroidota bacterium]